MKTASAGHKSSKSWQAARKAANISLFSILLSFGVHPCHALDVTFRASATVSGPSVTLAEIADFNHDSELANALAGQTVASSPDVGQKSALDTHSIAQKLGKTISTPDTVKWRGAETVTVERQGVTITPKMVQEIIDGYLKDHARELPNAKYTFTPADPPLPFMVPTGELKWEVTPSNPAVIGSNRFSLIGRIDTQVVKNFSVRGTLEAIAPVAVAMSNLRHGDIIAENQIQLEPRDLSTLRAPSLQPDQVVGKKLLRSIKAGAAIDLASVEFPPMVKKGTFVKILGQKNGLELTATGIAKTDGKLDQVIKVKNATSDKEIFCRVTAPGLVEVQI